MLVLSRKMTESVVVGSGVRITILKIDRNQVRIGIEAPGDVSILRAELVDRNQTQAQGQVQAQTQSESPARELAAYDVDLAATVPVPVAAH